MSDPALVHEILRQLQSATTTIIRRFTAIDSVDDFTSSDVGLAACRREDIGTRIYL